MTDRYTGPPRHVVLEDKEGRFRAAAVVLLDDSVFGPGDDGACWIDVSDRRNPLLKIYNAETQSSIVVRSLEINVDDSTLEIAGGVLRVKDGGIGASKLADGACLAEILDDDGAGSGLDADLVDGNHASAFAAAAHDHDDRYYTETEHGGVTPQGHHAAVTLAPGCDSALTLVGQELSLAPGGAGPHDPVTLGAGSAPELTLVGQELTLAAVLTPTEHTAIGNGSPHHAPVTAGDHISLAGQQVSVSDGVGSGLIADLLDGLHANEILEFIGEVAGSTNQNTNSSTWSAMADCSLAFTVPSGKVWDILVLPSVEIEVYGNQQYCLVRVNLDDSTYKYMPWAGPWGPAGYVADCIAGAAWFPDVAAGDHTLSLEWSVYTNGGNLAYSNAAVGPNTCRRLIAFALVKLA